MTRWTPPCMHWRGRRAIRVLDGRTKRSTDCRGLQKPSGGTPNSPDLLGGPGEDLDRAKTLLAKMQIFAAKRKAAAIGVARPFLFRGQFGSPPARSAPACRPNLAGCLI